MKKLSTVWMLTCMLLLVGCNGSSGKNNDNNTAEPAAARLAVQILLDNEPVNQFKADQSVQIVATLLTSDNLPIANEIINFSHDVGTLSTDSALTDSDGIAQVSLTGGATIGAGILSATVPSDTSITASQINYQIVAADTVDIVQDVRIGYLDADQHFIEGAIKTGSEEISAGGTLGLSVDLIDAEGNHVNTPIQVSFDSNCVASNSATIDTTNSSVKGQAHATFQDISCAGASGTDDVIIASITVNGVTSTATTDISITGEQLGSIEFISAEPTSIVLKGTGGQGKQETSTLTFQVKSNLGNPLAQQQVEFTLDTQVGGIAISPSSSLTNSEGLVTTKVTSGTVPSAVRVSAKAMMTVDNAPTEVLTQSDLLSVNTGLPEQRSITISTTDSNPEAGSISGVEVTITARLADNFNNPVPDGTTVNFTTEGGMIESSCHTVSGACSVIWTSAEPRVPDHRITVLATALGHETFFDTNGNNTFDDNDGTAIVDNNVSSGNGRAQVASSGFVDMSEAWRDDNENGSYDVGETFLDFNDDNTFSTEDGLFNGPQCQGNSCAAQGSKAIHVRKALRMIMASSGALYSLYNSSTKEVYADNSTNEENEAEIADGSSTAFTFDFSDTAFQAMPSGTVVSVTSTVGELDGTLNFTVPKTLSPSRLKFFIINPAGGNSETGLIKITITSPSGIVTPLNVPIKLN